MLTLFRLYVKTKTRYLTQYVFTYHFFFVTLHYQRNKLNPLKQTIMSKLSTKNWEKIRTIALSDRTMRRAKAAWEREHEGNWTRDGYITMCVGENNKTTTYWWSSEETTAKRIANTHYMRNKGRDIFHYVIGQVRAGEFLGVVTKSGQ